MKRFLVLGVPAAMAAASGAQPRTLATALLCGLMAMPPLGLAVAPSPAAAQDPPCRGEQPCRPHPPVPSFAACAGRSGASRFVDFDQTEFDINALQSLVGFTEDFVVPNYYIRGAITQLSR
jgi:hypothetical protein